jgi:hypothetical protein
MHLAVLAPAVLLVVVDELQVNFGLVRLVQRGLVLNLTISTSTYRPKVYGCPSGRGIFRKASTSPIAGMNSGMKAFNLVSSSWRVGAYLRGKANTSVWT